MKKTLEEVVIFGVKANIPLLLRILSHEKFVDSKNLSVKFFEENFKEGLQESLNPSYGLRQEISEKIIQFKGFDKMNEQKDLSNPWFES